MVMGAGTQLLREHDQRINSPQGSKKIIVINPELFKIFSITEDGLSKSDQRKLARLGNLFHTGDIDVISFVPSNGVVVTERLIKKVAAQIISCFECEADSAPSVFNDETLAGLHFDVYENGCMGEDLRFSRLRLHVGSGVKIPQSNGKSKIKKIRPYFVLGSLSNGEYNPFDNNGLCYEGFIPTVAIPLKKPTITLFRSRGSVKGPHFPVVHGVVTREVLDMLLSPDVNVALSKDGKFQDLSVGDRTVSLDRQTGTVYKPYTSSLKRDFKIWDIDVIARR